MPNPEENKKRREEVKNRRKARQARQDADERRERQKTLDKFKEADAVLKQLKTGKTKVDRDGKRSVFITAAIGRRYTNGHPLARLSLPAIIDFTNSFTAAAWNTIEKADAAKAEELEKAKADAAKAKADLEKAKADAAKANTDSEKAKADAAKANAQSEADAAKAKADAMKANAYSEEVAGFFAQKEVDLARWTEIYKKILDTRLAESFFIDVICEHGRSSPDFARRVKERMQDISPAQHAHEQHWPEEERERANTASQDVAIPPAADTHSACSGSDPCRPRSTQQHTVAAHQASSSHKQSDLELPPILPPLPYTPHSTYCPLSANHVSPSTSTATYQSASLQSRPTGRTLLLTTSDTQSTATGPGSRHLDLQMTHQPVTAATAQQGRCEIAALPTIDEDLFRQYQRERPEFREYQSIQQAQNAKAQSQQYSKDWLLRHIRQYNPTLEHLVRDLSLETAFDLYSNMHNTFNDENNQYGIEMENLETLLSDYWIGMRGSDLFRLEKALQLRRSTALSVSLRIDGDLLVSFVSSRKPGISLALEYRVPLRSEEVFA